MVKSHECIKIENYLSYEVYYQTRYEAIENHEMPLIINIPVSGYSCLWAES